MVSRCVGMVGRCKYSAYVHEKCSRHEEFRKCKY